MAKCVVKLRQPLNLFCSIKNNNIILNPSVQISWRQNMCVIRLAGE